jgi:hypothetical protein
LILSNAWAQGPKTSYYYNPATELSWAQCYLYQQGGSRQKIQFLPVINNSSRAPSGTNKYSKDIDVNGPIVFIGNGIVKENICDSYVGYRTDYTYADIDVTGKIVMFCYDFPDSIMEQLKEDVPLTSCISEAASRKASAVILFSYKEEYPFLMADIPDIPVISITRNSAINILASAGRDGESIFKEWEESGKPPKSEELISKIELKIQGHFDKVETENFMFRFRKALISEKEMEEIIQVNEKSVRFLLDCFKDEQLTWEKVFIVYFRDYDAKLFYTHHWGKGLACDVGIFIVHEGGVPNFGLAVHENTHQLIGSNWSGSTSFMIEGVAMYAEALATDKDKNHLKTVQFLKENKLFPLKEMLTFSIGMPGLETEVAYPASGSFVDFLIKSYGLKTFKSIYRNERKEEDSWQTIFGKSLSDLEEEWLDWLAKQYKIDEK